MGLGEEMQWSESRPRHVRDPKTRSQEDTLQVMHAKMSPSNGPYWHVSSYFIF